MSRYDDRADGNRFNPRSPMSGDDSVPCRWWHESMSVRFCDRCGSGRRDLHEGVWEQQHQELFSFDTQCYPRPWTDAERIRMGLLVDEQWWHQAAGLIPHEY